MSGRSEGDGCGRALFRRMAGLIMLLEQILAKVASQVAPYGVDVIGLILRVIKFNEEGKRLDAIIAWVATINATSPGEVDIPSCFIDLRYPASGEFVGHVVCVFFHERHERIELQGVHRRRGEARGLTLKSCLTAGPCEDIPVRDRVHDCDLLLVFVKSMDQLDPKIVLSCQRAQALPR